MKTAISLPDEAAEQYDQVARRLGMTRSEFYRQAAEHYVTELDGGDLTAEIDAAIEAVGQPGDDSATWRRAANARLVAADDEW